MSDNAYQRIDALLRKLLHHACQNSSALLDLNNDKEPTSLPITTRWCTETCPRLIVRAKLDHLTELALEEQLAPSDIHKNLKKFKGWLRQDLYTLKTLHLIEDNRTSTQGALKHHFTFRLWHPQPEKNLPIFRDAWKQLKQAQKQGQSQTILTNSTILTSSPTTIRPMVSETSRQDWGNAPDVPVFYGRTQELKILKQWILQDQCSLIAILGMKGIGKTRLSLRLGKGGIGKTDLSLKLAKGIQTQFDFVIWRSLINALTLQDLLQDLIQFLSKQQENTLPDNPEAQISRLLHYLRQKRCLLILDNAESILQPGSPVGAYRPGYEPYGQLLQQIGEGSHQSCLLLTSREEPHNLRALVGQHKPVRRLELGGLSPNDGQAIFKCISQFTGTDQDWQTLIQFYNGNPLALELAANHIDRAFSGKISAFLQSGKPLFSDLRELLDWHFERLSEQEQELLYWLAINREPVTVQDLQTDLLTPSSQRAAAETIQSLQSRLPLERSESGFTLQPVLIEYVSDRFTQTVCQSIQTKSLNFCNRYPLLKASAPDYIRDTQQCLLLTPVLEQLREKFQSTTALQTHLNKLLEHLRIYNDPFLKGYAPGNLFNLLCLMESDMEGYDLSNLCLRQADFRGINLRKTSFQNAHIHQCEFSRPIHIPMVVKFSRDGELIAVGETGSFVNVYATKDAEHRLTLQGHRSWSVAIDFHPAQAIIATGSMDATIKLWELETGKCFKTLQDPQQLSVWSVCFTADGQQLLSASVDGHLRLWDLETEEIIRVFAGHANAIYSAEIHPDGTIAASSSEDHTIKIWDMTTGKCRATLTGHTNSVRGVAFSPDGTLFASGSLDSQVKLWQVDTLECIATFTDHQAPVNAIAFSPDSQQLISGSEDETLRIWDLNHRECIKVLPCKDLIMKVAYSPRGDLIAGASYDNTVPFWKTSTWKRTLNLIGYSDFVMSFACQPSKTHHDKANPFPLTFFSAGKYSPIRKWHLDANQDAQYSEYRLENALVIEASPNGDVLTTAGFGSQIQFWDAETIKPLDALVGHINPTWSLAFNNDGTLLASASLDHTIKLWDLKHRSCMYSFTGHSTGVWSVVFSPDQKTLISCSLDTTIKIWSLQTYECLKTLKGHQAGVRDIALSSDGRTLVSGSFDGTVKIWELPSGDCRQTLTGHTNLIWAIALSPNDKLIASCGHDGTIRIWDTETGKCLHVLNDHTHSVWTVSFTPDSLLLLSGSDDQTIRIWNVATGDCLKVLTSRKPYEGMNIEGIQGLTRAEQSSLQALGAI